MGGHGGSMSGGHGPMSGRVESGPTTHKSGHNYYQDDDDEYEQEITQIDCWTVITSFFDEKGLVGQQLESFNEFLQNTIQEIVDDDSRIVHQTTAQHTGGVEDEDVTVWMAGYWI